MKTQMTRAMANLLLGCGLALLAVCAMTTPGLAQAGGTPWVAKCQQLCGAQSPSPYSGECMSACQACASGNCDCYYTKINGTAEQYATCLARLKDRCKNTGRKYNSVNFGLPIIFDYGTRPYGPNCGATTAPGYTVCSGFMSTDPDKDICSNECTGKECGAPETNGSKNTCMTVKVKLKGGNTLDVVGCRCWHGDPNTYPPEG